MRKMEYKWIYYQRQRSTFNSRHPANQYLARGGISVQVCLSSLWIVAINRKKIASFENCHHGWKTEPIFTPPCVLFQQMSMPNELFSSHTLALLWLRTKKKSLFSQYAPFQHYSPGTQALKFSEYKNVYIKTHYTYIQQTEQTKTKCPANPNCAQLICKDNEKKKEKIFTPHIHSEISLVTGNTNTIFRFIFTTHSRVRQLN